MAEKYNVYSQECGRQLVRLYLFSEATEFRFSANNE